MTDKEKLSCLIDRPCTACKFHTEEGCSKWSCVFDQNSELPEGEYIKKTDVLDKAVIETLSDYTEHDVVYVDEINKLPTFAVPERENGMTNGEVIQALFPNPHIDTKSHTVWVGYEEMSFTRKWWNAPYQKGGE